jgi:hypothetical protein
MISQLVSTNSSICQWMEWHGVSFNHAHARVTLHDKYLEIEVEGVM